jgi:hypothetical protein
MLSSPNKTLLILLLIQEEAVTLLNLEHKITLLLSKMLWIFSKNCDAFGIDSMLGPVLITKHNFRTN